MQEEKRLIDANALLDRLIRIERGCLDIDGDFAKGVRECQHAVISAYTEKPKAPATAPRMIIKQAFRSCSNCGALVTFNFDEIGRNFNKDG